MYQFPFLDFKKLNEQLKNTPTSQKLQQMYECMKGQFHDNEKELMKGARLGIVSLGGLPIGVEPEGITLVGRSTTPEKIRQEFLLTSGMSAFMSYLNPKGKDLDDLSLATLDKGHESILHCVSISILIVGLSMGVEQEISSQRDLVHLSRLTVAKTRAQEHPCLVLKNPQFKEAYKKVLASTKETLCALDGYDDAEARNLLFPSSKASAIMITGSLKNIKKLISLKDAGGKEDELIEILEQLEKTIAFLKI